MTASSQIKEYLSNIPEGQPFLSSAFRHLTTTENIRQVLNRLVKSGELKRVARGVFAKAKQAPKVGEILPSATDVVEALAKATGETIVIQGAEAARKLQLTTQVPMRLIFYTNGNTRTLKISNRTVILKHVNPSRLIAPGTTSGLVISALYYLGRENVTIKTIEEIKTRIPSKAFQETINLIEHMPGWMSDVFYHYQHGEKNE